MKGKDIIVMGLQSWDSEIGSNCINIAIEFSKNNRVLYVNRALDRVSMLRAKSDQKIKNRLKSLKKEKNDLTIGIPNLWVLDPRVVLESINWLPSGLFQHFNKLNNKRLSKAIKMAMNRLEFKNPVLFIDNDFFRSQYLAGFLGVEYFIYYIRDYLIKQPYFRKHGAYMESRIIAEADLVVANSPYLANYAKINNPNSIDIGQGCDFTYFNPQINHNKPEDLRDIKNPVIGYVGALVGYRLDIDLLINLAKVKTEWSFVLVGPEDEAFSSSLLHQLENVYFLGRKEESQLAGYVSSFDVCINPQLVNEATVGNYPRKVDEYLALGKPVVATYTDFMLQFSDYVHLCKSQKDYVKAIEIALQEKDNKELAGKRQSFALSHTWENSVQKIYNAINHTNNK